MGGGSAAFPKFTDSSVPRISNIDFMHFKKLADFQFLPIMKSMYLDGVATV